MHVQELWRYPVKSMRGERITVATLARTGVVGDRNILIVSANGDRVLTARTHPGLLGLRASIDSHGSTLIEGLPWHSPEAQRLTARAAGAPTRLIDAGEDVERFDVLPLLVATDGAIHEVGIDGRRLRPNVVIGGVPGQEERSWPGANLLSGEVTIRVAQLRMRCVMTTYDPDNLTQDLNVLRNIVKKAQGKLALDCAISHPGVLRVGDAVTLAPPYLPAGRA